MSFHFSFDLKSQEKKNPSKKKNSFFIHSIDFTPKGEKNDLLRRKKKNGTFGV